MDTVTPLESEKDIDSIRLEKPAYKPRLYRTDITVRVTDDGQPLSDVNVRLSRSVSGQALEFRWQGSTDPTGEATIEVLADPSGRFWRTGTTGYYILEVSTSAGEILGRWDSIPLNDGRAIGITLETGNPSKFFELVLPEDEDGNFTLFVSNQDSDPDRYHVDIGIHIDGRRAIDQSFAFLDGHNWIKFTFTLEPGNHALTARSVDGDADLVQVFNLEEGVRYYSVVDYYGYYDYLANYVFVGNFSFDLFDHPIAFALRSETRQNEVE